MVFHGIADSIIMSLYPVIYSVQTGLKLFTYIVLIFNNYLIFLGLNPTDGGKIVERKTSEHFCVQRFYEARQYLILLYLILKVPLINLCGPSTN